MKPEPTATQLCHRVLASRMAADLDEQLRLAINRHIGHARWKPADLVGRLEAVTVGGGVTDWMLDNELLLTTWPIEVEQTGNMLTATRPYASPAS